MDDGERTISGEIWAALSDMEPGTMMEPESSRVPGEYLK